MDSTDFFYTFGRDTFGPVLAGYTHWLVEQSKTYDKLLFLSRGGYILRYLYEMLKTDDSPPAEIMFASRRCYDTPGLASYMRHLVGGSVAIGICDTGWWGGMQDRFEKLLPDRQFQGFYLGTRCCTAERKSGFAFERWWDHDRKDVLIFEDFLNMLSGTPGVKEIRSVGDKFEMDFDVSQYNARDVNAYRHGVLDADRASVIPDGRQAFEIMQRIRLHPTPDEIQHLGAIKHDDQVYRYMDGTVAKHWRAARG